MLPFHCAKAELPWEELFMMWGLCQKGKNSTTPCGINRPTLNLSNFAEGWEAGSQEARPRTGNRSHPTDQLHIKANPQVLLFMRYYQTEKQLKVTVRETVFRKNAKLHYFSWILITLWTIGMSLPSTLNTTISPALIGSSWKFVKNKRSPLWKAGSMLPLQEKKEKERVY